MPTTYPVIATASNGWWAIEVQGLPKGMTGYSQARRLTEVEEMARSVVVDLLECDPSDVAIDIEPRLGEELEVALDSLEATARLERLVLDEIAAARAAAIGSLLSRLTQRELATILGVSHQRISQMAKDSSKWTDTFAERASVIESLHSVLEDAKKGAKAVG